MNNNRKIIFITLLTLVALYSIYPTIIYFTLPKDKRNDQVYFLKHIPKFFPKSHIKLGLDIQGGVQLVLGVNLQEAIENRLGRLGTEVLRWSKDNNYPVTTAYVVKGEQKLRIEFKENADIGKFREHFIKEFGGGFKVIKRTNKYVDYTYSDQYAANIKKAAEEQAERVIRTRVDKWGVSEPLIARRSDGSILVQLPGFSDPQKAKDLLGRTAQLKFKIVDDEFKGFDEIVSKIPENIKVERQGSLLHFVSEDKDVLEKLLSDKVPQDKELLFEREEIAGGKKYRFKSYVVYAATELSGEDILDAWVSLDNSSRFENKPAVSLKFTGSGAKRFADITGENVGKLLAIILDNEVVSAPQIRQKIAGGNAIITLGKGNYNTLLKEASDLSLVLKSGALPATIKILEERQVGATLGPELAQKGIVAVLIGLVFVLAFMILYYKRTGLIAAVVLILNGIYLIALMAGFGFALTLPGIAGFILTLGMAIDANVLINERIKSDLKQGKNTKKAVTTGFNKVIWTILDANITTLIAAFVLLETNPSGPIRGFAITLIIGLLSSLFTSLYCSKTFIDYFISKMRTDQQIRSFFNIKESFIHNVQKEKWIFPFISYSKIVSLIVFGIFVGVISVMSTKGLNWAVDFSGGAEMEIKFENNPTIKAINNSLQKVGIKGATIQKIESENVYIIRFNLSATETNTQLNQDKISLINSSTNTEQTDINTTSKQFIGIIQQKLIEALQTFKPEILRVDYVGPQVGKELRIQGALSLLWAIFGIFAYIFLRFDIRFAPGAILKMFLDTFVVLSFYAFLRRSFDLTSVAALLTIIGYSVNDVVVIYDRIREMLLAHSKKGLVDTINLSIKDTIPRTINTSLTTILALIGILIYGTPQIWNFGMALAIGVICATITSIFIASASIKWFEDLKSILKL